MAVASAIASNVWCHSRRASFRLAAASRTCSRVCTVATSAAGSTGCTRWPSAPLPPPASFTLGWPRERFPGARAHPRSCPNPTSTPPTPRPTHSAGRGSGAPGACSPSALSRIPLHPASSAHTRLAAEVASWRKSASALVPESLHPADTRPTHRWPRKWAPGAAAHPRSARIPLHPANTRPDWIQSPGCRFPCPSPDLQVPTGTRYPVPRTRPGLPAPPAQQDLAGRRDLAGVSARVLSGVEDQAHPRSSAASRDPPRAPRSASRRRCRAPARRAGRCRHAQSQSSPRPTPAAGQGRLRP